MSDAPDLGTALAAVRAEREKAAKRVAELDRVIDVLAELHGDPSTNGAGAGLNAGETDVSPQPRTELDRALKDAESIKAAAELVIRGEGEPMRAAAIAKRIANSPFPYDEDEKTLRRSVASALARNCDEGDTFFKKRRGVYGLPEMKNPPNDGATAKRPDEPVKRSSLEPVGSAEREEEASKTSLPLSGGS